MLEAVLDPRYAQPRLEEALDDSSELAAPFQLARPTIASYVTLLERVFLIDSLPPWHSNRLGRLVKSPKLHIGDTGLAAALLGLDAESVVKAAATVTAADFRGLHKLREAAGERFVGGVVLYDGEGSVPFGDRLWAVPLRELWAGLPASG